MAVRDILNYEGEIIGQLELPDATPEEVWAERLASFINIPPTLTDRYVAKHAAQRRNAESVMAEIRLHMITNMFTLAQTASIYHQLAPELLAVQNGAFEVAIYMLQTHTPDSNVTEAFLARCVEIVSANVVPL